MPAGLWDELGTDWILLDAELLPWSAKAEDLLRHQYAAVGAAANAALSAAVAVLEAVKARGIDVDGVLGRTTARAANTQAFTAAYRRRGRESCGAARTHREADPPRRSPPACVHSPGST
ncbi:MAG: hypothetical protein ACOH2F_19965 [Cellulomonas sp.]